MKRVFLTWFLIFLAAAAVAQKINGRVMYETQQQKEKFNLLGTSMVMLSGWVVLQEMMSSHSDPNEQYSNILFGVGGGFFVGGLIQKSRPIKREKPREL